MARGDDIQPASNASDDRRRNRSWSLIAVVGPGIMLAATGVGAGDLAGAAFAGMKLGTAVLWAVVFGAFFKFVITEGLARWQLATNTTLLEGAALHLGRGIQWLFLAYLLVWTFGVGASLISACGVAAHALFPIFEDAGQGKVFWGVIHSLVGLILVLVGTFRFFERLMGLLVALMVVVVMITGWMVRPDWQDIAVGLLVPTVPDQPEATAWTLALMGGVGGTLTVLCYGYWIREEHRTGIEDLRLCRLDLGISYCVMALFGISIVIIATGMELSGKGATLVVDLATRLQLALGTRAQYLFLGGAWAAVFSSLVGVWQSAPYLFADFWQLFRQHGRTRAAQQALWRDLTHRPGDREAGRAVPAASRTGSDETRGPGSSVLRETRRIDTRGWPYRGYLVAIAVVPMLGLRIDFEFVQKANSVFGSLVMPMLAAGLLVLNGREDLVGKAFRNRRITQFVLLGILFFFLWVGAPKIWTVVIGR